MARSGTLLRRSGLHRQTWTSCADLVKLYRWNHGKRIDLVVDTDEFSAVHSMGAKWDTVNLSWYITANMETTRFNFKRWMRDRRQRRRRSILDRAHPTHGQACARLTDRPIPSQDAMMRQKWGEGRATAQGPWLRILERRRTLHRTRVWRP